MIKQLKEKITHIFNAYSGFMNHWSSLVFRNGNGMASFLHIRKGVTHGGPLFMVTSGIGFFSLIKFLKTEYLDVTQSWHADDAGALGMFDNIGLYFNSLK